ncbi:diacylglycerol kinase [Labrys wisconsinensis]|uniref:Diacylglycerol kinase n=1 Tax=Labrys wisconsinensis TaxID=425677 RepID=A0ABU0J9G7_9HYPH|nr:diacylglycerol kinase [Labrys wisconsinensis]MDQ0470917.1 diacylglycerol kinase (ATP) [Labrys wisconsinensis]
MERIIKAFFHSWAGWSHAIRTEQAVQQEAVLLAIALPASFLITDDNWKRLALIGVLLILLAVEFLNTAIEKLADHVRPDLHPHIKVVKDLGSAAVFMLLLLSGLVWLLALWERFA